MPTELERPEMLHGIILSLVQFDFSYSSAMINVNSEFNLGLSASKSNLIKAICNL